MKMPNEMRTEKCTSNNPTLAMVSDWWYNTHIIDQLWSRS